MESKKLHSYIERLGIFTLERALQPYAWGLNDCVTFAADGVWAMTGTDPIADIRYTWTDEPSAMAVLDALGGLVRAVDTRFPYRVEVAYAQRGDLCAMKLDDRMTLGICVGSRIAAPGMDEMLLAPLKLARVAWRV